jgi:outer membrane protein W
MIRRGVFAVFLVSIAAGSASAQSFEVSGLAGLTTAGDLEPAPELTDVSVRGGFTWGIQGARFFTPRWGAEVVFTQQASGLEVATSAGTGTLYDITLSQLQANVVYQFGANDTQLRPFVFGGAGATFFSAHDLDSATKASFGFGGGLKYFPRATLGFRGQLRFKPTWLNDDAEGVCDPFGFCQAWLQPLEIAGGVIIRF